MQLSDNMWLFQKCLFQLIERLTVLQRRKRELARESVKLQTKVANSLRSAVEKNFLTMIFFGKNKTFDVFFQEGQNWCYRCISSPVWDEQRGGEKGIWKNYRFCRHNIHTICNRTRTITITHLIISCKKTCLYFVLLRSTWKDSRGEKRGRAQFERALTAGGSWSVSSPSELLEAILFHILYFHRNWAFLVISCDPMHIQCPSLTNCAENVSFQLNQLRTALGATQRRIQRAEQEQVWQLCFVPNNFGIKCLCFVYMCRDHSQYAHASRNYPFSHSSLSSSSRDLNRRFLRSTISTKLWGVPEIQTQTS